MPGQKRASSATAASGESDAWDGIGHDVGAKVGTDGTRGGLGRIGGGPARARDARYGINAGDSKAR
jgi:hypothetical protein